MAAFGPFCAIDRYIEKCINSWVCKKMKKWSHVTEKKKVETSK